MADSSPQGQTEPSPTPSDSSADPAAPAGTDDRPGRYDANVQLILRRLADHQRTATRPKRWWQSR